MKRTLILTVALFLGFAHADLGLSMHKKYQFEEYQPKKGDDFKINTLLSVHHLSGTRVYDSIVAMSREYALSQYLKCSKTVFVGSTKYKYDYDYIFISGHQNIQGDTIYFYPRFAYNRTKDGLSGDDLAVKYGFLVNVPEYELYYFFSHSMDLKTFKKLINKTKTELLLFKALKVNPEPSIYIYYLEELITDPRLYDTLLKDAISEDLVFQ